MHPVGSAEWLAAVGEANVANSKHMAEEERQGLTDFRHHASVEERHFRRVATRYDKLAGNFVAMVQLAAMRL